MKTLILIVTLFACVLIVHAQTPLTENINSFTRSEIKFQNSSIYNSYGTTHDSISAVNGLKPPRCAEHGILMNAPVSHENPKGFVLKQDMTQGGVLQKGIIEGTRRVELQKDIFSVPVATSTQIFDFEGINYNIISTTNKTVEVIFKNPVYSGIINIPLMVSNNGVSYTVTSIGDKAFYNCPSLTSVTIPTTVTSIGDNAFASCTSLTSVTIPTSITSIGRYAFYECRSLTSVTIPASVTSIGFCSFLGCTGLTTVKIPSSVTSIGSYAFEECSGLIDVDSGNLYYSSKDGVLYNKSKSILIQCPISKTGTFTIPSSVTTIGEHAFLECTGLTTVSIPTSVTSIEKGSFGYCGLTSVTIPSSVTSIGNQTFYGCSELTSITIPSSVTSIGRQAFMYTAWYNSQPDGLLYLDNWVTDYKGTMPANTSITINNGTVGIAGEAFFGFGDALTSITIPNSVKSICEGAFYYCTGLTSVTISNTVTNIGDHAFEGCYELTSITVDANNQYYSSVGGILYNKNQTNLICCPGGKIVGDFTIPVSVTNIGDGAFYASELTSVIIPNSVTSIGEDVFDSCLSLTSVTIPNSVTSIGQQAFSSCYRLTSVTIPNSVTSIGDDAFSYCIGLTSITLSNSLTSIGVWAFNLCESLTSITIPGSVISIGNRAFQECSKLSSITVDANNQYYSSVGGILYDKNQTNLLCYPAGKTASNFTIPDSVKRIGMCAFYYCTKLTSVTIPNSVTKIESEAFYQCTGLTSVTIPNSVTSIGSWCFGYCTGLMSVSIPISVAIIEYNAFTYCSNITKIICKNPTPPTLGGTWVFGKVDNLGCILKVPNGCKAVYQAAEQWKDFTNILELGLLSLSSNTGSIGSSENSKTTIDITSNTNWTVSSNQTWINVNPKIGSNNATLEFTATLNPTTSVRTGIISIIGEDLDTQTIIITQAASAPMISVLPNLLNLNAVDGSSTINITSNTTWTATSDQPWLSILPATGLSNQTITVNASNNLETTIRTATITISVVGVTPITIIVNQATLFVLKPTIVKKWNDVLICDNSSQQYVSYQWYKNDSAIPDAKQQFIYIPNGLNDRYFVEVSDNKGYKGLSNILDVTSSLNIRSLNIYPNPNVVDKNMTIEINLTNNVLNESRIIIYSSKGEIIRRIEDLKEKLSLQFNNQGTYILQLQSKEGIVKETTKFIINY